VKLTRVRIENYRSIVDSGTIDIEDGVTVLIGKNEQGKSNTLRAIRAFNADQRFSPGDLPNHLRPALEERAPDAIPIVTFWFALEPQERKKLAGIIHDIDSVAELRCVKDYGNTYHFYIIKGDKAEEPLKYTPPDVTRPITQIKKIVEELKAKLHAHADRLPAFATNIDKLDQIASSLLDANLTDVGEADNIIKTFTTSIKVLTGPDQPILDDIAAATTEIEGVRDSLKAEYQSDQSRVLRQALPHCILHSTKSDHIPNEVNVADFVKDPDATSKGMSNLCRAAGLSVQKIRELAATSDTAQREAYEDHYKGTISGGLNEFWTQASYNVHFRIEKERLSVSISDETYTQRIPPSDRSEGFQWYLSFFATLLNDVGVSNQTLLLLDNPGLELHLDGQRDIKRFLEEKVSLDSQIIYVTHSPAMIEPFNLKQVRTVDLQPNQKGTVVKNFMVKSGTDADLLEPVRAAIGMSLVSSLVLNEWNILVEGAADKPIVEGVFISHYNELQSRMLVNGSLAESKDAFLAQFYNRTGLPYVVLLDGDSGGRELFLELTRLSIPPERIVKLEKVFPDKDADFSLEDILSIEFYHQAVLAAYPSKAVDQPGASKKKRTTLYEETFKQTHGIGFNKRRVGDAIKKLLNEKREEEPTRNALGILSTVIVENLKAQVPHVAVAQIEGGGVAPEAAPGARQYPPARTP
jgi:predicted ATP-dependent endonuclease of OLD family